MLKQDTCFVRDRLQKICRTNV